MSLTWTAGSNRYLKNNIDKKCTEQANSVHFYFMEDHSLTFSIGYPGS